MNILVLYQSPWWNAAAYYTFNVVKALKQMGHNIFFVGKNDTPLAKEISIFEPNITNIDLFTYSPITLPKYYKQIKKVILENQINVVIPVSAPGHIFIGLIKKYSIKSLPILKICLDNVPPVNNFFNRQLHNKLTDYFLFPGNATKMRYDQIFRIEKFKILHAPLDLKVFTKFSDKENKGDTFGTPEDKILVSFIGRFSPEKGIFFLLDIVKEVKQKTDKLFFLFSGQEGQIKHTDVIKKVEENGLQNFVKIIDKVDDVRDLISISDIGLLSSRYSEFICRIAMEFMALKIPVVVPELNVIPEVVEDGKTGFIYKLDDAKKAAQYLIELAENKELRRLFGENGFERINRLYSLEKFEKELVEILAQIV